MTLHLGPDPFAVAAVGVVVRVVCSLWTADVKVAAVVAAVVDVAFAVAAFVAAAP